MTLQDLWLSVWQSGAGIWLITAGLKLLVIILVTALANWLLNRFIRTLVERMAKRSSASGSLRQEHVQTVSNVFARIATVAVWLIALLMVLSQFGINITPILTGAGILGIAIGFGAQELVRNFFAGIFILIEDQYSEGDDVELAGIVGKVESFDLRRTVVRTADGSQYFIPNGEIKVAANKTK